jgi:DNA invertase Pin-like site-specific DNA recombinase
MPAQRGRPSTCTPELASRLRALIAQGWPLAAVCRAAGIDRSTLWRWQQGPEFRNAESGEFCPQYAREAQADSG